MCGIAGVITADPKEAELAIRRMVRAMVHRGPDDGGHELLPTVRDGVAATAAFGFRRLAILDLSPTGHQPMVNRETGDCLIFNGEIYNFRDLRRDLESLGTRFLGSSDSEVLLHALGRWGDHALERLEGMYAFAFYRSADRRILIARDPLGIKPLYVAQSAARFMFASEIRTLLASQFLSRSLDPEGIAGMLAYGSVQAPQTVFREIREFPAGHCQWIGSEPRRFWSFPEPHAAGQDSAPTEMVRERVVESVHRHLVADVPVGVFLSAGIDSTIIAACAAESGAQVTSFTVGIGSQYADDEVGVAAATARQLGIPHRAVPIEAGSLVGLWQRWIASLDSPSIDGFNTFLVTKALADQGMKVGLSGLGADELFGGYPVFRTAPRLMRLLRMARYLPRGVAAGAVAMALRRAGRPGQAEKLAGLLTGNPDLQAVVLGLRRVTSDSSLGRLGLPPLRPEDSRSGSADDFTVISRTEMTHYMKNTLLRDSDANSMSHSLELRVPFLDQPLVNAVMSLPGAAKEAAGGPGKRLLREAMASLIPKAVARRPKTGFSLPLADWMRGEMREFCAAAIESAAELPMVHGPAMRQAWHDYVRDPVGVPWSRVFSLIVLGNYLGAVEAD
jgi:asparagine synthase (glutamine-hydrolysing)